MTTPTPPELPKRTFGQRLRLIGFILAAFLIYAYAIQITEVGFEKPREENRQTQVINALRGLAQPDLFEYHLEEMDLDADILIPCSGDAPAAPDFGDGPTYTLSTNCAAPGAPIVIEGAGFEPGESVFLKFIPDSGVELKLTRNAIVVQQDGTWRFEGELKDDRESDSAQQIRATLRRKQGIAGLSENTKISFEKIIETVFLAFMATTAGLMISIPLSFVAARNLMAPVKTPFVSLMAGLAVAPVGWWLGLKIFNIVGAIGTGILGDASIETTSMIFGVLGLATVTAKGSKAISSDRWRNMMGFLGGALLFVFVAGIVAALGLKFGLSLQDMLGDRWGFIGRFVYVISDGIRLLIPVLGALTGASIFYSIASTSINALTRNNPSVARGISFAASAVAVGLVVAVIGAFVNWLYALEDPTRFIYVAGAIGAGIGLVLALLIKPRQQIASGLMAYTLTRTLLNIIRALEPLIMAIVFVIWVGIGPFAGVLALSLHTIAALAKLFSEQIESIAAGPIEAITATGANKLQTILYAVIPQIIPPYIAFTLYRWDINVRMSTIIGFAGGGGIGFLVNQNMNLLKYRQASVQMIMIAIVVIILDFVSSRLRERFV